MRGNKAAQQALINILNGIYGEIHTIEKNLGIRADEQDYRPRIEYFHDAVRALTSGASGSKRLSVEFLAYDIAMLRHIQSNPVARPKGAKLNLSPSTGLITGNEAELLSGRGSMNARIQLADLYKNYSVLFVALLSESADDDYYARISACNAEVENTAAVEQAAKKAAQKQDAEVDVEALIENYVDDPELAHKIFALLAAKKNKIKASEAQKKLSDMMKAADKQIKTIEQAHFNFATSQLAIYENAREVVKKMAMNGMNIVGNFVEHAVHEASRGGSRGM